MIRSYSVRGKIMDVEEIPSVAVMKLPREAIAAHVPEEPIAAWQSMGWRRARELEIPSTMRRLWENAGWYVVEPLADQSSEDLPKPALVGRLLRNERGEWMIGTPRLTVRLRDDLDESEVRRSLDRDNLNVIRRLKFAPHLYEVQIPDDSDCFDVAVQLSANNQYAYAEPQLIRHLGGR